MFVTVASLLWSIDRQTTVDRIVAYLLVPGFCLYSSTLSFTKKEFDWIILAAILGGIVGAVVAYRSGAVLDEQMADRMILTNDNDPNNFAALLLLPFALAWWKIQDCSKTYQKIVFCALLAVIAFIIFMTGSRGGFLSIIVILVSYYLVSGMFKRASAILGTIALLFLLFFLLKSFLPADLFKRLFSVENYTSHGAGRTNVWQIVLREVVPHMGLLGLGAGCVSVKMTAYYGFAKGIHNTYLNMFCEFGILGLPVFILMIGSLIRNNIKRKFYIGTAMLLGICTTIFFLDAYAKKFFWNIIMIILLQEGIVDAPSPLLPREP